MKKDTKVILLLLSFECIGNILNLTSMIFWLLPIFMVTALDYEAKWLWALTISIPVTIVLGSYGDAFAEASVQLLERYKLKNQSKEVH